MRIHGLHHYSPCTSGFVPKIKKWCRVSMSRYEIHDPWPSIHWKYFESTLQFHLKAINGPYPSCGKKEKNSTLREKLLWRNYSLHIESASLYHFEFEHIVQPQTLPYLIENLIVSLIWSCLWWRIELVEAQLEGTWFLDSEMCWHKKKSFIHFYWSYFNRNTLFASN